MHDIWLDGNTLLERPTVFARIVVHGGYRDEEKFIAQWKNVMPGKGKEQIIITRCICSRKIDDI